MKNKRNKYYKNTFNLITVNEEYHPSNKVKKSVTYRADSTIFKISYYNEYGKLHRDPLEGFALCIYKGDNNELDEGFYLVNGKKHNPYGPAVLYIYVISLEKWYLNGIEYTNEVEKYLKQNNLNYKTMTQTDFDIMWTTIL